jgi:DNA-binding PadR family transcriptional regulator
MAAGRAADPERAGQDRRARTLAPAKTMASARPSLLEHALLGLVHQQPRSGYALRKVFATTPMAHYSDSPGTIYPALGRLQRRGWISGAVENGRSLRPQRVFSITARGLEQLKRWLAAEVTVEDVAWRMDDLMLRFAFIEGVLGREAATRFLGQLGPAIAEHLRGLERFSAEAAPHMPIAARLALESGIAGFRAQGRWATYAVRRLEEAGTMGSAGSAAVPQSRGRSARAEVGRSARRR